MRYLLTIDIKNINALTFRFRLHLYQSNILKSQANYVRERFKQQFFSYLLVVLFDILLMGRFMSGLTISQLFLLIDICCRKWNDRKGKVSHFHLRVHHSHFFPKILPPIVVFLKDLGWTPIHRWLFRSPLQNKKTMYLNSATCAKLENV